MVDKVNDSSDALGKVLAEIAATSPQIQDVMPWRNADQEGEASFLPDGRMPGFVYFAFRIGITGSSCNVRIVLSLVGNQNCVDCEWRQFTSVRRPLSNVAQAARPPKRQDLASTHYTAR